MIGRAPHGDGRIVYVGSSNGKLYALDAATGARRWSFDTTPSNPALSDRNDLNGSPALGKRGVYIGGEHGRVWFVPYDYCRAVRDSRCTTNPGQEFGADVDRTFPVTPGGTTVKGSKLDVPASTVLGTRLIVRRGGTTANAGIDAGTDSDSIVHADPPFDFQTELSGDGQYLFIRPDGFLAPNTDYRVRLSGGWKAGTETGGFDNTLRFRTDGSRGRTVPLRVGAREVGALEISRLALPLPSLLPSVNQIGFDSYDLIAGTLKRTKPGPDGVGRILMWVVAAQHGNGGGAKADPNGGFAFPLYGTYKRDQVALNASQVSLQFSFGAVPLRSLDFRGSLAADGSFRPGASLYGQVTCADVPNYSSQLRIAGVCNASDTLASYGTFLSDAYGRGGANQKPAGVRSAGVTLTPPTATTDGEAVATLSARARRPLPGRQAPRVDPARRPADRRPGEPRLPDADQPGDRRAGQHRRGAAADPGRDGAARDGAGVHDCRRVSAWGDGDRLTGPDVRRRRPPLDCGAHSCSPSKASRTRRGPVPLIRTRVSDCRSSMRIVIVDVLA